MVSAPELISSKADCAWPTRSAHLCGLCDMLSSDVITSHLRIWPLGRVRPARQPSFGGDGATIIQHRHRSSGFVSSSRRSAGTRPLGLICQMSGFVSALAWRNRRATARIGRPRFSSGPQSGHRQQRMVPACNLSESIILPFNYGLRTRRAGVSNWAPHLNNHRYQWPRWEQPVLLLTCA